MSSSPMSHKRELQQQIIAEQKENVKEQSLISKPSELVIYQPNYLRSGFYDEIDDEEETRSLIDRGEDYFSVGDPDEDTFEIFTAEGG